MPKRNYLQKFYLPIVPIILSGQTQKAVGLGVSVALKHWDAEAQKVTDDCPDRDNIQFQITAKIKEYEKKSNV